MPVVPVKLLWRTPKYLVPLPNTNGDTLVVYYPKKKKKSAKAKEKIPKIKSKPVPIEKIVNDGSSISGSSLQENHIDPDQVSDFLNGSIGGGTGRSVTPRLIVHPPSSSGSLKSDN